MVSHDTIILKSPYTPLVPVPVGQRRARACSVHFAARTRYAGHAEFTQAVAAVVMDDFVCDVDDLDYFLPRAS